MKIQLCKQQFFARILRKRLQFNHANDCFFRRPWTIFFLMPDNSVSRSSLCHANTSFFSQFQRKELMTMLFSHKFNAKMTIEPWLSWKFNHFCFLFRTTICFNYFFFLHKYQRLIVPNSFSPQKKEVKQMTIRF